MNPRSLHPSFQILVSAQSIRIIAIAFGAAVIAAMLAAPRIGASGQNPPAATDADTLPDGPGKAVVVKACLACHNARQATSFRGTEDEWADEVNKMMGKGAVLSDDEVDQVVEYLAAHFGPAHAAPPAPSEDSAQPPAPEKSAAPSGPKNEHCTTF